MNEFAQEIREVDEKIESLFVQSRKQEKQQTNFDIATTIAHQVRNN